MWILWKESSTTTLTINSINSLVSIYLLINKMKIKLNMFVCSVMVFLILCTFLHTIIFGVTSVIMQ